MHIAYLLKPRVNTQILILDPEFYNILVDISQSDIVASSIYKRYNINQSNTTLVEKDSSGASYPANPNITTAEKSKTASQASFALSVTVPETAAVMEAIINWLYEKTIPEDSETFGNIYKAACKYNFRDLRVHIESQIEQRKENIAFITEMMEIALEQSNEEVLKKLVSVFKKNKALLKTSEFTALLDQYGVRLMEHFIE